MTYTELEDALYEVIAFPSPILIIWANENGLKPDEAFATLNILPSTQIGLPYYGDVDDNGERVVSYHEDFTLSIISYGRYTKDNLQTIKDFFYSDQGIQMMKEKEIAIRNDGSITDISIQIDNKIEKRFLYEFILEYTHEFEENVGFIEDLEYTSTINQPV